MPLDRNKLKQVYATLQKGGYSQDYNTFEKGFSGGSYKKRKEVYDLLSQNGAQIGNSYEDFMGKLYGRNSSAASPAPAKKPADRKMSAVDKLRMINSTAQLVNSAQARTNTAIQRIKRQVDETKKGKKTFTAPTRLGENPNVSEEYSFNPETGKLDKRYITESGNEYENRAFADFEQGQIDKEKNPIERQLQDAYAERDRIDEAMKKRKKEIDDESSSVGNFLRDMVEASRQPGMTNPIQRYDTDEQYRQLNAAWRKNRAAIQTLEDKKQGKMNSFWHTLGTTLTNGYTLDSGLGEMNDAIAIMDARKHINSINKKRSEGKSLTKEEEAAEAVLKNEAVNSQVQGMYGGDYGAWARAGSTMGTSIDMMAEILEAPGAGSMAKGIANKVAGIGAKYLAKTAGEAALKAVPKTVGRALLKGTGILVGAHTAGAVISNTTGLGHTVGMMGTNLAGRTYIDNKGNLHNDGGTGLMEAFADAERNQIRENGSEMFGNFIPGAGKVVSKGLEKLGLSKISGALTSIGNKEWYRQYSSLLKAGGYSGIPGEAIEEYEGMAFDALTGHAGEALDQLKDPKTHVDIWLGTATMSAMFGSIPVMVQGYHTAQYYRYKHKADVSDAAAGESIGQEKWQSIRDRIDGTPNEKMTAEVMSILSDSELNPEQKNAALGYVRDLTKMRGFNIAQISNASDQSPEAEGINQSYSQGYNAATDEEKQDAKNRYDIQRQKAEQVLSPEMLAEIDNDPMGALQLLGEDASANQSVIDYINAKQVYDGMIQRVRDDIDGRIEQSNSMIDSRVNREDGTIRGVTMKVQDEDGNDRRAYILKGNLVMFEDGTGIDHDKSDASIVIRDAETGAVEMVSPDAILSMEAPVDPEIEKQAAAENIRQQIATDASNHIEGVLPFNQGDTYTLTDGNGQSSQVQIMANKDGIVDNGDGTVNVSTDGGLTIVPMSKDEIQQMSDATNRARVIRAEQEQEAMRQEQAEAARPQYAINDIFTITDENGNAIRGSVQAMTEDGVEIHTEEPLNGSVVQVIPRDEFEGMLQTLNDEYGNVMWQRQEDMEPKPIGTGAFGGIYDQFKGKVKEAFDFLLKHKSGDLVGVFHREDIGDIDLVWGDETGGLAHIIKKHINEHNDFKNVDDAISVITDVVNNGKIVEDGKLRYKLENGSEYTVVIRKDYNGEKKNWIVTAIDMSRSEREKRITTNPTSTPHGANEEGSASSNDSVGKDSTKTVDEQGEGVKNSAFDMIPKDADGNVMWQRQEEQPAVSGENEADKPDGNKPNEPNEPDNIKGEDNGVNRNGGTTVNRQGSVYSLSDKKAGNGEFFYKNADGNIDLVNIPKEVFEQIGYTEAPFRLTPSMMLHMLNRHGKELGISSVDEALEFVLDVMNNFDHVRLGYDGALIFSEENGRKRTGKRAVTILINSDNGKFYGLKSSGYEAIKGLTKRPSLWERGAKDVSSSTNAASVSVSTGKSSLSGEQSGSASHQSEDLSVGKDSTKTVDEQGEGVKNSALERIPKDEKGNPVYEQTDSDTAWDAIVEQTEGNEDMAQSVVDSTVKDKEAALKKAEKATLKGKTVKEKIDSEKERQAAIDTAKAELSHWQKIARTRQTRQAAALAEQERATAEQAALRKAEEERQRAEREEAERKEREALNGVPDMSEDTPQDARARGYRRVTGHKVDRQEPVQHLQGKKVSVKFSNEEPASKGHVAVIEASSLQPSHIQGNRNPAHFIDEAQPKERNDQASVMSARKIAGNMRPGEITSSVTAYTGAPTVNTRGEVIQGNSRSDALRLMWNGEKEQAAAYKQYLKDHAEEFGLNADEIDAMEQPVLVNMLDVDDADAIRLGQYVAQDTESGGVERIKAKNVVKKMGSDMGSFTNLLLKSSDEDISFSGLVDNNGAEVLKWMNRRGYITPTQYSSAFDSKGNITAEAKNDLKSVMYQSIFQNGNTRLEELFNAMPAKAQRAILATAFRDYDSPNAERMVEEIQNSIMAYNALSHDEAFMSAKNWKEARMAVESWKRQYAMDDVTGESYLPAEKFSNFALHLATMYKGESQGFIQSTFNQLYDLIQGTQEETLFEQPDNTPRTLAQAIKETLNIDYNGQQRSNVLVSDSAASQERNQGSTGSSSSGERAENGEQATDSAGGTEGDSGKSGTLETHPVSQKKEITYLDPRTMPDDEKERRGQMLRSTHVTEVGQGIIKSTAILSARKAAEKWWDDNVSEAALYDTEVGEVEINRNSIESSLAHRYGQKKLDAITSLPEGFENAVYLGTMPDSRERGVVDHYFAYPIMYDGELNYVFCRAMQDANKNRLYVHEVFVGDKIKKGDTLQTAASKPHGGISLYRDILANVLQTSLSNSSEWHLAEHQNDVPDLLPTQESNVFRSDIWRTPKDATTSSAEKQGLDYAHPNEAEDATKGSGITPQSTSSVGKDTKSSDNKQEKAEKFVAPERKDGESPSDYAERVVETKKRFNEEQKVEKNPTEAQKEAGNYKKGHIKLDGYDITIENPKGSVRSGVDGNGKKWETEMHNTYGYIRGTEGVDGDHIDVYLSDNPTEGNVFVVDQVNPETGEFDEHKVMYGFPNEEAAREAYLSNYSQGWKGLGTITEVSKDEFKKWIDSSHRKTKPFAEYKSVKREDNKANEPDNIKAINDGVNRTDGTSVDRQGNPIDSEGRLVVERVNSVDEITDEDFTNPTRNVELPKIPDNVDNAIGAEGKPVVIKKNIFERNAERHGDLSSEQSRDILQSALYNPGLYGQNQKSKRPHNWILINVSDKENGGNKLVLLETNRNKDNVEIVHWHYVDKRGLEKIKRQAEREDGQLLILPSENPEEVGALSDPTHGVSSVGKDTEKGNTIQTERGKSSEKLSEEDRKAVKEVLHDLAPKADINALTDKQVKDIAHKNRAFEEADNAYSAMAQKHTDEALDWLDKNYPGSAVITAGNGDLIKKAKSDPRYKGLIDRQENEERPLRQASKSAFGELSDAVERYTAVDDDVLFRDVDDTYTDEEQDIIDKAKAEGTYMKAPNGKKTNLTEKQWVQVRTRAFKDWFGDWEKTSRIGKLRKSKPVRITGEEIEPSEDLKQYKKNALEYGKNLQGSYVNKDTGHEIQLQRGRKNGGINEVLQHNYKDVEHLQSVAAIPQLIENGIYITSRENTDIAKNPNVKEYQYYVCGLKINNTDYTVRFTIAEDKNGNRYYDHKLTRIEKGKLLDLLKSQAANDVGFGTTPGTKPTTDISAGKDKVLLSILQTNSSKVLDKNGEPLVVYHGTTNDKVTRAWNASASTYDTTHEPFYVFSRRNDGGRNSGFFFNSDYNNAAGYGYTVYETYVSLRNPLVIDANGAHYSEVEYRGRTKDTYEWAQYAERNGYDGIIFENVSDGVDYDALQHPSTDYVAFKPNQVKSATGNTGSFSRRDDDIRFRDGDGVSSFASEHGLNEEDVRKYADSMRADNLGGATFAFMNIRRCVMLANRVKSLGEFTKIFSPIKKELYERFGNVDELKEEAVKAAERERGLMEAAQKKAEEEAEAERKRLEEFQNITDEELDGEYAKAVEAGDESRMRDLVNEAARRNGYGDVESTYQGVGAWSAPSDPGYESDEARRADVEENSPDVNVMDMSEGYTPQPNDYFTNLRAYGHDTPHGRESAEAINKAMEEARKGNKPTIKVYRAVPETIKESKMRNGDWVTPSRKYAEMHGNNRLEGKYRIIEQEVPADELWWDGNDINEWGFDDGKNYAYRNTKNNRKLNELITRDDSGNIIPLSQRFNARKADVRFRSNETDIDKPNEPNMPNNRIDEVNRKFNEELQQQIDGSLPKGHVYQLGMPSSFLQEAGIPNLPIEMPASQLSFKATSGKHDFNLSEVTNLPKAIAAPIATFAYGDKEKSQNILTTLEHNGERFLVGLFIRPTVKGNVLEVNSIRNVFPKNNNSIVRWILEGKLTNANKKELLNFLDQQRTNHADVASVLPDEQVKQRNSEVSYAANIVENFENPRAEEKNLQRNGDDRADEANEPNKNKPNEPDTPNNIKGDDNGAGSKSGKEFAERERKRMAGRVQELSEKLHLDNVDVSMEPMTITGRDGKEHHPKGFFNRRTGRITVVIPNHVDLADVEQTLLHEAVAHYGLRELFGEHFDTFLDNVLANADISIRRKITEMAARKGWDFRVATEEYLASLAERTNFENMDAGWWSKIKELFFSMLHKIGFEGFSGVTLTDNELRYILWRSYENLAEPGRYRSILGEAADVAKQYELKVGNYADRGNNESRVADNKANEPDGANRNKPNEPNEPDNIKGEDNGAIQDSANLSDEVDENGIHFVKSEDGTTEFGVVTEESGLSPAPIKLSRGFQDENGKGYGLAHIEANHGDQIRNAGYKSVEDFVSFVAKNYDENNIRVGKRRHDGSITYLIQVTDEHDNTIFIEMSKDGSYWNVNSAGIFRKGYSNKKETVAKTEPQQPNNAVSGGSSLSEEKSGGIISSEPNGKPTVSVGKDSTKTVDEQGEGVKNSAFDMIPKDADGNVIWQRQEEQPAVSGENEADKPDGNKPNEPNEPDNIKAINDGVNRTDGTSVDRQGNPIDSEGRLVVERVNSVDEITDEDFTNPTRNVELPKIPDNVDNAIGAEGKPVVIKKNIFEKNAKRHGFSPQESRKILSSALYNTDIVGQSQPMTRKNHWVAIKLDEKSPITVLEVNDNKDNVEIVGWYTLDNRNLERIRRQAEREGGELLILTPQKDVAASLSTLPPSMSSVGKDTEKGNTIQTERGKSSEKLSEEDRKAVKEVLHDLAQKADINALTDEQVKDIAHKNRAFEEADNAYSAMAQKHTDEALDWLDKNYPGSAVITAGNGDLIKKAKSDPRYKGLIDRQENEERPLRQASKSAFGELSDAVERYTAVDDDVLFRDVDDTYTDEEQDIIDKAKAEGTYMKAPNGKKTNLTEKQWVQVRTRAFKDWFGDWEKASRIGKLRKSKPVRITGEEYQGKYELNRDSAKKWIKDNLRGEYTNKDTGEKIEISKIGANKVTSHGERDEAHLKSIVVIPQLIEDSIFIDEYTNEKGNGKYDSYRYYVCGLKINDENYTVKIVVGVKDGSKFYDHRLTEIEKGTLIDNLNVMANHVAENQNANNSIGKDTKLLSILQTNSSKVLDKNGEPLVVYHGTLAKDLTRFKKDMVGSRYSYDDKGFFFISNKKVAYDYSLSEFDSSRKGIVVDTFVSLRNPLVVDSKWCRKNGLGSNVFNDNDAIEFWDNYQSLMLEESENNDGVIITDGKDTMVVAFEPNQVKSATGNTGSFSRRDDDIRFRIGGQQPTSSDEVLKTVNGHFNEELQRFIDGTMDKNEMFHLGMPQGVMSHFLPDLPIVMRQRIVTKGSVKKHNVAPEALRNMPSYLSSPIFVFQREDQSLGILTEIKDMDGKNVCIAIELNKTIQNGKQTLEVNDIRSFHGREIKNIVLPIISNNTLKWVDKEKALAWFSSASQPVQQEITKQELDSAANIVENFENPRVEERNLQRNGDDRANEPNRNKPNEPDMPNNIKGDGNGAGSKSGKEFAERERKRMAGRVQELAEKLHLDNVDVSMEPMTVTGRDGNVHRPKGFFNRRTGRITVVIPNHVDLADVEQTLLHEAVAHYGLRELFGEHFDTFLDNVLANADISIRRKITEMAARKGWDFRVATEEYLASLAERTNFENMDAGWWSKIKELFLSMLHKIGFEGFSGVTLTDNELRYILWRSYENLAEPGRYRSIFGEAEDIAKQNELKVGNYADRENNEGRVADNKANEPDGANRNKPNEPDMPNNRIDEVNRKFNEQLGGLTEDNADKTIFSLGRPSEILRSAGVEDKPMKLYGNKVMKKMRKHGFKLSELKNLPKAVANPIAVFDNYQKDGNRSVLTELQIADKNILVSITIGKDGVDTDFNIVSSVFGKGSGNIIDWLNKGYATYINKEKALRYLHFSESSISEASNSEELDSAAKIVENFENPSVEEKKETNEVNIDKPNEPDKPDNRIDDVNRKFNEQLGGLTEDNADKTIFSLGRPSAILRSAGVEDMPMKLYGSKVMKKMRKHGFSVEELHDLPNAVSNPIAVFDNYKKDGNRSILTELKTNQGNFLVTLDLGKGMDVDFNIITSAFGKRNDAVVDWINKGYATYINKEKALNYLHLAAPIAAALDNQELNSAAKIVENFENPRVEEKKETNEVNINKTNEPNEPDNVKGDADDVLFRDGDSQDYEKAMARDIYEKRVSKGMYQSQEALQDSMLSLKEGMKAVYMAEGKKHFRIEDVAGFENAYLGENRLSSVNKAECDAFAHLLFKPLLKEVSKLARNADERAELTDYMMAKHGLERNRVMAERDAQKDFESYQKDHPNGQKTLQDFIEDYRMRDYAGLTTLTGADDVATAEAEARRMVDGYENSHETQELWKKVNAVTKATLSKVYESGLMSKKVFEDVKSMYECYIPLRGFDEKTGEDQYAYLNNRNSSFNAPIKTAKGRKSKADDPLVYMESMAESAIMQGNRNVLVKQKFLNFALNHPSDLVSVSELWLQHDDVTDEWKPVFPDNITGEDSPADVERKMQDFEERMSQLAEKEPDKYKRGKDAANIPYRVVENRDMQQHQVIVKRGGKDYVLTINGNPRLAQALNGQTNPDNDMSGAIGVILKAGETLNRHLSAFYTTRNPDFIVSNFIRDMLYANSMVWVKESPNYALRFHKNVAEMNPVRMKLLFARYREGKLDMNDKTDAMFRQFMMNGGETGYANIRDIDKRKNDIRRELKKNSGRLPIGKAWDLLGERFDEYNRAVENCARFAAFVTSREMGRTIDRSIYDAKEISVNFNKKGSGAKFMGANGQTKLGNVAAFTSGIGRSAFVFWNAAIQGTTNFGRQAKRHPAKAFAGAASMFLLGALIASLGAGDDDGDDKNAYYNLPEYVRRSNIVFRLPWMTEQWISIPLPVEYRAIYGMGELMSSTLSGKEHFTDGELAEKITGQVSQMLPIDFMEGGGGFKAFIPSAIKPFAEVLTNKGWTGMPIYKDTPWNKNMPEWTKAYKSANKNLVNLSMVLNEATGGDKYTKGVVDINPSQVEYVLRGYFGGAANTIDKLSKTGETIAGEREYDPKSFLILNRVLKSGDERTEYKAVNNEYFRLKDEHDRTKERLRGYENEADMGILEYAEKADFLYNSPEYQRMLIFEDYDGDIKAINDELKEVVDDNERKGLEREQNELKKEMIEEMNKTRNGK